jgi:transcription initiation factor TFIID subunit TAF12
MQQQQQQPQQQQQQPQQQQQQQGIVQRLRAVDPQGLLDPPMASKAAKQVCLLLILQLLVWLLIFRFQGSGVT